MADMLSIIIKLVKKVIPVLRLRQNLFFTPSRNKVLSSGMSRARFSVPKKTVISVQMIYGIAYFSIGFAKDNNLR